MITTDRRRALASLLVASVAPAALLTATPALAKGRFHRLVVGDAVVTVLDDGAMTVPVPFALPGRSPDDLQILGAGSGGVTNRANSAVIAIGPAVVLVDCGGGSEFMPTLGGHSAALEAAGVAPDSVTHVVFTHAHFDHFWGLIDPLDETTRFPSARHVMTRRERDTWLAPDVETRMPEALRGAAIGTARRLKLVGARIETVTPGTEIIPGITLVDTRGHTDGHVSVLLNSRGQSLLIGGDALVHWRVAFEHPDWRWGPDAEPDVAASTRKRLLDQLATDRTALLGYHLPWPGVGHVERKGAAFQYVAH